jgi:glycosyltransferase involved in cell wall biosynthesis
MLRSEGAVVLMEPLLRALLAHDAGLTVILYINPELIPRVHAPREAGDRVRVIPYRPSGMLTRLAWEQIALPRIVRRERADVLLSVGNTGPLFPGCRQILYVQQSVPFSDFLPTHHRLRWRMFRGVYRTLIAVSQMGADRIVVFTSWLVAPLRRSIAGLKPARAYLVAPPGLPDLPETEPFGTPSVRLSAREREVLEQLDAWRLAGERILFYPSYLAPYKHLQYLAATVRNLHERGRAVRLVLTAGDDTPVPFPEPGDIMDAFDGFPRERVLLSGNLGRAAVAETYRRTDVLVFTSVVEALGLPLLEAMSQGVPIVATQSPDPGTRQAAFAREICGSAALYADHRNPVEFAERVEEILGKPDLRARLATAGRARAAEFSWAAHVAHVLES